VYSENKAIHSAEGWTGRKKEKNLLDVENTGFGKTGLFVGNDFHMGRFIFG